MTTLNTDVPLPKVDEITVRMMKDRFNVLTKLEDIMTKTILK